MSSKGSGRRRFLKRRRRARRSHRRRGPEPQAPSPGADAYELRPSEQHAYGERSRFEDSTIRIGSLGRWTGISDFGFRTPLQESVGVITPPSLHYIVSHGYDPPNIDPRQHRLLIHGMVDRPLILTMEDLRRLPSVSRTHFLAQVQAPNSAPFSGPAGAARVAPTATIQQTHGLTSCSEWTGVPVSLLLEKVGTYRQARRG